MIKKLYKIWNSNTENKKIMVLAGSGLSMLSGVNFDVNKQLKTEFWSQNYEQVLKKDILALDPNIIWEWVLNKREEIIQLKPNINHYSLVKLEKYFHESFSLITNNIDNLHNIAGIHNVIEMNGNLFKDKPLALPHASILNINWNTIPHNENDIALRPNIILNGEKIEKKNYLQAHLLAQSCDICFIIGSKLEQDLFGELPAIAKKFNNAKIIEINPDKAYFEDSDLYIQEKSEHILPLLVELIMEMEEGFNNISSQNN